MTRIIYKDINDNLCVVQHVDKSLTKEEIIKKDILPYCPSGIYHEVDFDLDIPKDRYFRDAWSHDETGKLLIDRLKAEEIHMRRLKEKREIKLNQLDKELMIAFEKDDNVRKSEISALKQQLRDMPLKEDLSKCKTLDELKNYVPEYCR